MRTTSVNNQNSNTTSTTSLLDAAKLAPKETVKKTARGDNAATEARQEGKDNYNVNLSSDAREIAMARAKAHQIAANTSPIREDRVAELKEKIKNGTYKVDSSKVADGILMEAIKDELSQASL